jgi:PAS domain S-box-containing protein
MGQSLHILPPLLTLLISLALAALAVIRRRFRVEHWLFAAVCTLHGLVALVFCLHHLGTDPAVLLTVERRVHFFYVFLPAVLLLFVHRLLGFQRPRITTAAWLASSLIATQTQSPLYFRGLLPYPWGTIAAGGPVFAAFAGYSLLVMLYVIACTWGSLRRESNRTVRLKNGYILLAFSLSGFMTLLNIPAILGFNLYPASNFSFVPLAILGYGVLKHRILDIRSILHLTLLWLLVSSLLLVPNALLFAWLCPALAALPPPGAFLALCTWFMANHLYLLRVQPLINRRFQRRRHNLLEAAERAVRDILTLHSREAFLATLGKVLHDSLNHRRFVLLMRGADGAFHQQPGGEDWAPDADLERVLQDSDGVLERAVALSHPDLALQRDALRVLFARHDADIIVPIVRNRTLMALVLLPERERYRPISGAEIAFLRQVAGAAAIALANLEMYQSVSRLKDHLEQQAASLSREVEERVKTQRELGESERKYTDLLENIEDGFYEVDLKGRISHCNRSAEAFLGYGPGELRGVSYRRLVSAADADRLKARFNWIFLYGGAARGVEGELRRKDGSRLFAETSAYLARDAEGKPVGFRGLVRDISSRKRAAAEQQQLAAQLQNARKMEAIGRLAGGVAHDLNNILSGLVTIPEVLLLDIAPQSPLRKPLEMVQKAGERAAAIVQDLLTLARRGGAVAEVVSLNRVIVEYLQSAEFEALRTLHPEVRLETRLAPELCCIEGSPVHLSKSVMNLILNAMEAMPAGGVLTVATANQMLAENAVGRLQAGLHVVLTVADEGIGIPPEDLDRIFEPFFSRKPMGRSGTGLGMAVVWGTVNDHRGHVEVASLPGKGTTFTLTFPASDARQPAEPVPVRLDEITGRGETLLVVDDEREQREIARFMLEKLGYTVLCAAGGEEAIEMLRARPVQLLILDMLMDPGMDGLDTYRGVLALHPGQRAIITSGYSASERVEEARSLGVCAYLRKPYRIEAIGRAVRAALRAETG